MGHFKLTLLTSLIELGSNMDTFKVSFTDCLFFLYLYTRGYFQIINKKHQRYHVWSNPIWSDLQTWIRTCPILDGLNRYFRYRFTYIMCDVFTTDCGFGTRFKIDAFAQLSRIASSTFASLMIGFNIFLTANDIFSHIHAAAYLCAICHDRVVLALFRSVATTLLFSWIKRAECTCRM